MSTHLPVVHTVGSAFIGRISRRSTVRINAIQERLTEDEVAVLRRFELHEHRIAEALALIGQREERFDQQLRRVSEITRAFLAGIDELLEEH